jgi:hypothetical protein
VVGELRDKKLGSSGEIRLSIDGWPPDGLNLVAIGLKNHLLLWYRRFGGAVVSLDDIVTSKTRLSDNETRLYQVTLFEIT